MISFEDLKAAISPDFIEHVRLRLDDSSMEDTFDPEEHDSRQIRRCLEMFVHSVRDLADNDKEEPTVPQMLASIIERLDIMATVAVTQATFDAHLNNLEASVSTLVAGNSQLTTIVTQLVDALQSAIAKGTAVPTSNPADFFSEDAIVSQALAQLQTISDQSTSAEAQATNELNQAASALSVAPPGATATVAPASVEVSAPPAISVQTTPAPASTSST